jgi:peptidoglycan/xylan/chitin deacetylase (PgdA/CDA1 family)
LRRRERRRRIRRRRLGLLALLLPVAAGLGMYIGLRGGGEGKAGTQRSSAPVHRGARPPVVTVAPTRLTLPPVLPSRTLSVPILMYHRIDVVKPTLPAITQRLTVDPSDFAAQMRWLEVHGYHTLAQAQLFRALEHGARMPSKPIVITFDDGYRDIFGKAMPILRRLRMRATAYVITSRISGPDVSFLTWPQLHSLERSGIEIGSHTVHHTELPSLSDPEAQQELIRSRRVLEQHLGHPVQWFAYPAGAEDPHAVELVRQAGYVLAVTTKPGTLQRGRAPLELHRFEVLDSTGVHGLAAMLASAG